MSQAVRLLSEAVGVLKDRVGGDLGKAVLSALKTLAPFTPDVSAGVGQSELQAIGAGAPAVKPAGGNMLGGPSPMPRPVAGPPMMR